MANTRRNSVAEILALNSDKDPPRYIIVACEKDLYLVEDVMKARVGIFTPEFVFSAVVRGKMDFDLSDYIVTI